jgi:protein arginine N-methyltransferase 1
VDHDLSLTSSPLDRQRAPHWGFRILRTERDDFAAGDEIEVRLTVGRWCEVDTWRWSHVRRSRAEIELMAPTR